MGYRFLDKLLAPLLVPFDQIFLLCVDCPTIVKEYNEHMGWVDLFDMLMSLYKLDHKSCKWYRRIFFWVLNVAIVNGWILYRRHTTQKGTPRKNQLSLLEFTGSISESLVIEQKLPPLLARKGPGRPVKFSQQAGNDEEDKDEDQNEEQHADTKKKTIYCCQLVRAVWQHWPLSSPQRAKTAMQCATHTWDWNALSTIAIYV